MNYVNLPIKRPLKQIMFWGNMEMELQRLIVSGFWVVPNCDSRACVVNLKMLLLEFGGVESNGSLGALDCEFDVRAKRGSRRNIDGRLGPSW